MIINDSLSILTALKNLWPKNKISQKSQCELIDAQKIIEFMWVGIFTYVGINGNEKADEAVFLATNNLTNNTIDKIGIIQ